MTDSEVVGQTITDVRHLTQAEMIEQGWQGEEPPVCLVLGNGIILFPSRDEEGNGPGVLFGPLFALV